jgi:myo-inositol 2-dehydrogenase/D-chiro-inositol 1-dehydrogenase
MHPTTIEEIHMSQTPLRFGLIGTGRIGQVHAASIAADPDATLAWVADPFIDGATSLAQRYGSRVTDSSEELLSSGEIDAVLVASSTPTHIDLIAAAIHRGLPVLCEKPIDLDIARVDALRPLVASSGVPVAMGFNRRFDPHFKSARERVASGEIGALEQLLIVSRDPSAPPASYIAVSGGIFRDMTIHDFDMARFFVPDIIEVSAVGTNTFDPGAREHGDYDTAVTTLRSASGVVVTITNSRHSAAGYDQRLEAFGGNGMLTVANAGTSLVRLSNASVVEAAPPYQTLFLERYAHAYAAELHEFVKLARGEASTSPTFEDGRAALVLADAAQRAATERIVVPVSL